MADPNWKYNGTAIVDGDEAYRWLYVQTNDEGYGTVSRFYEFLTRPVGPPPSTPSTWAHPHRLGGGRGEATEKSKAREN